MDPLSKTASSLSSRTHSPLRAVIDAALKGLRIKEPEIRVCNDLNCTTEPPVDHRVRVLL